MNGNLHIFYILIVLTMEETVIVSPNNDGNSYKLQITQKNTNIRKRKVKTWTLEEDEKLAKLYELYPKKWGLIAAYMKDRNENQCLHRFRRFSQLGGNKKIWSVEEDEAILSLMKKVGKNWKLLAELIGTKTGKQIRERFINKLDPRIKNEDWTDEQDKLILRYYSQYGSKWSEISKKLEGRPENKIKNRFYSFIRKNYDIRLIALEQDKPKIEEEIVELNKQINKIPQFAFKAIYKVIGQDIYEEMEQKPNTDIKQPAPHLEQLKDINLNTLKQQEIKAKEELLRKEIPSIKEFPDHDLQNLNCNGVQINKSEINLGKLQLSSNKNYLQSLIKVDEDIEAKFRSMRDIISNSFLENQCDLFYLSY